jgi:hypothetical protein
LTRQKGTTICTLTKSQGKDSVVDCRFTEPEAFFESGKNNVPTVGTTEIYRETRLETPKLTFRSLSGSMSELAMLHFVECRRPDPLSASAPPTNLCSLPTGIQEVSQPSNPDKSAV